jgi:hypothetical protein
MQSHFGSLLGEYKLFMRLPNTDFKILALFAQLLSFAFCFKSPCGKNMFRYSLMNMLSKNALM